MTHADMKIDEFSAGLIFPVQPHLRTRTHLHESDQLLGQLEKLLMTFRRVLESARTRLAPEAIWAAKQLEALDFIICFQELHQLQTSLVTLALDYISAVRPRRALSFSACMLHLVMPHLCIWLSSWCAPTSFHSVLQGKTCTPIRSHAQ